MIALFLIAIAFLVVFVAFAIGDSVEASRADQPLELREIDSTPLMDDAGPLPDHWERPNVVKFQPRNAA